MLRTPIGRLRVVAFVEGVSYLVLLSVAMPLKYFAGMPSAVKTVGWVHGVLFVLYLLAVAEVAVRHRWPPARVFGALAEVAFEHRWPPAKIAVAFVASLVPFGTFVLDRQLRREQDAAGGGRASGFALEEKGGA